MVVYLNEGTDWSPIKRHFSVFLNFTNECKVNFLVPLYNKKVKVIVTSFDQWPQFQALGQWGRIAGKRGGRRARSATSSSLAHFPPLSETLNDQTLASISRLFRYILKYFTKTLIVVLKSYRLSYSFPTYSRAKVSRLSWRKQSAGTRCHMSS